MIIDIFILDGFNGSRKDYLRYIKTVMLYADCVNPYSLYGHRFPLGSNRYPVYQHMMKRVGRRPVLARLEKKLRSFGSSNSSQTIMRWSSMPLVSPATFTGGLLGSLLKIQLFWYLKKLFLICCGIMVLTL